MRPATPAPPARGRRGRRRPGRSCVAIAPAAAARRSSDADRRHFAEHHRRGRPGDLGNTSTIVSPHRGHDRSGSFCWAWSVTADARARPSTRSPSTRASAGACRRGNRPARIRSCASSRRSASGRRGSRRPRRSSTARQRQRPHGAGVRHPVSGRRSPGELGVSSQSVGCIELSVSFFMAGSPPVCLGASRRRLSTGAEKHLDRAPIGQLRLAASSADRAPGRVSVSPVHC